MFCNREGTLTCVDAVSSERVNCHNSCEPKSRAQLCLDSQILLANLVGSASDQVDYGIMLLV